jgi:hypothetical protein
VGVQQFDPLFILQRMYAEGQHLADPCAQVFAQRQIAGRVVSCCDHRDAAYDSQIDRPEQRDLGFGAFSSQMSSNSHNPAWVASRAAISASTACC